MRFAGRSDEDDMNLMNSKLAIINQSFEGLFFLFKSWDTGGVPW
jgi:hypothetical protein